VAPLTEDRCIRRGVAVNETTLNRVSERPVQNAVNDRDRLLGQGRGTTFLVRDAAGPP
jgi:hypothetical protein